ncbi:MAG: hypothetical protein ACRD4M_12785 [Candidatus Acidiferrales bacterium]
MKTLFLSVVLMAFALATFAPQAAAQTGALDFTARATPSSGIDEPVRGFPFSLLRKSFRDISKEAEAGVPQPDRNAFIDKLEVSKELKAWMKKNKTVTLNGEDFIHLVKADDVMDVPEFYKAYMDRNADDQSLMDFPKPKYKLSDKVKHPEKYKRLDEQYQEDIRHYIQKNPQTIDGIDLGLEDVDPSKKWGDLAAKRGPEVERLTLQLAASRYFAGRTETDLQGHGSLRGIPAGNYWLSTLDVAVDVGDARPRWDFPVRVVAGETTTVNLSSGNAVLPPPQPSK